MRYHSSEVQSFHHGLFLVLYHSVGFAKCIASCIHHYGSTRNSFPAPKPPVLHVLEVRGSMHRPAGKAHLKMSPGGICKQAIRSWALPGDLGQAIPHNSSLRGL